MYTLQAKVTDQELKSRIKNLIRAIEEIDPFFVYDDDYQTMVELCFVKEEHLTCH